MRQKQDSRLWSETPPSTDVSADLQEVLAVLAIQIHRTGGHSILHPVLLSLLSGLDSLFHLSSHSGHKPAKTDAGEVAPQTYSDEFNWLDCEF